MTDDNEIDWENNDFGDYYGLACDKIARLTTERDEARRWARRMMAEREIWKEMYGTMYWKYNAALEENAALRRELEALRGQHPDGFPP